MNKQWLIGALSALMSLSVGAAVDETKVQSRTNAEFQKEISSNFTNLTPDAIAAGLRDLVIIGTVNQGEGNKPDIVWHSISKVVGNEQVAAALSEPLGSPKVTALPKVGEEFDIVGNLDSLLADYLRMMAEAKKNDITLKEEAAEKDSSASSGGSGTSGGYFDNNQTEKPDTGADDFVVKPDTTTKRTVECAINYDFDTLIASEMAKEETVSSNTNEVVSSTDCAPTGVSYPIQQDYVNAKCPTTTDYTNAKHYLAFRHYIDKSGTGEKAQYVSECKTDSANPLTIKQDISDCGVSENLTTLVATINKKWYYDEKGAQVFVSDCMPSVETYQIAESDADCVPFLNQNLGTVYTQSQLVWTDNKGVKHKVTECRPSTNELQLSKEYKGTLEHDFVGGASYEISRDYYIYNGEKIYVNEFSRDPSVSYPHYRSTDGCTTANDDANLRSRIFEKTFISKSGQNVVIKPCEATSQYVPYTYLEQSIVNGSLFSGSNYVRVNINLNGNVNNYFHLVSINKYCDLAKSSYPSFTWNTSTGSIAPSFTAYRFNYPANVYVSHNSVLYKRMDSSTYRKHLDTRCEVRQLDPQP
ncbi:TPA: hypothetical protein NJM71_003434 [Vibrio cholerae]|nr:hypothetical protein [Vibrio cholerae]HCG1910988.1 hypothetical protein [Vibrio cholerae]